MANNKSSKKRRVFVGDFETTSYAGQDHTEVWASAVVEMGTENVYIFHSIDETLTYFKYLNCNIIVYYHNLKFDGEFWLYYLIKKLKFKQAFTMIDDDYTTAEWVSKKEMPSNSVIYSISDRGQWYTITIRLEDITIELRDSLKLMPFSVKAIGKAFNTKHKKLDMEYTGFRYAGCEITDAEKEYIRNDVLVVKEALEFMFDQGHNKLTIGACCLSEYKSIIGKDMFQAMFPDLSQVTLDKELYGASNADEYIRHSYKGGWCYLVRGKANKVFHNGTTADVNSLYPSMMHSESGNYYPVGYPRFWKGNEIPDKALQNNRYFFIRIQTRFYIKKNKLPFIQIKGHKNYNGNECLTTSDYWDKNVHKYFKYTTDDGVKKPTIVTLTLTCVDYKLFLEHYDVEDFQILDGCYFNTEIGVFDKYIDIYKKIKLESKGAMRTLAKLFLNNLYGKLATNDNSSFKLIFDKSDTEIGFIPVPQHDKDTVYIAAGSAVTSYARNFTIRAAQANYHGADKSGFIYADTDSIHCDLEPQKIVGIKVHDKNFCCWKLESQWDDAIFVRQKTYIEHVVAEDLKPIDSPYYSIKCAGMPDRCKQLFEASLSNRTISAEQKSKMSDAEIDFLFDDNGNTKTRTLSDFKVNLKVPGKLLPKRIAGGVVLKETEFTLRG